MAQLIDPFDQPQAQRAQTAPQRSSRLVDPFDDPSSKYANAPQSQSPGGAQLPPLSPQQAGDYAVGIRAPSMTQIMDNPDPVGPIDAARIATIEDPRVRISRYAEQRFPNEPPEVREARYRDVDGQIVYRDPGTGEIRPEVSGTLASVGDIAGKFASPAIGSIVGLMMGGPVGSALGGMAGLSGRKLAGQFQGDTQTAGGNAADLAIEGTLDYVVPKVGGKVVQHVANRNAARDLSRLDKAAVQRLQALAQKRGITLTPAELSNMGSLINEQNRFSAGMDPAGDVFKGFYGERGARIAQVMDDFLKGTPDLDVAGASARKVAGQAIDDAAAAVSTGSRSSYNAVVSPKNLVPERAFEALDADPLINKYINAVKESAELGLMDAPRNSTAVIDMAGKLMREEADRVAMQTGGKAGVTAAALRDGRKRLLTFMERSYPAYNAARTTQAQMRATHLDPLTEGIEGVIAKTKDTALAGIPEKLLSSKGVSPASVANWRKQFVAQGMEGDWDKLVNSYLRQVWEGQATKGRTVKDLSGARFREMVFGTPSQQKIMREALGPKRFQDFSDLMEVFEATGRANTRQSMTQPALEAAKADSRRAMGPTEGLVVGVGRTDLTAPAKRLADWWVENRTGTWRESFAKILTSPEAVKELEKMRVMRQMSPGSLRKTEVALQALTKAGVIGSAYRGSAEASQQTAPQTPQ